MHTLFAWTATACGLAETNRCAAAVRNGRSPSLRDAKRRGSPGDVFKNDMIEKDARFYFANLLADVSRCVRAAREGNDARYRDSLARSYRTLGFLRDAHRPECYEEGLFLLRALHFARTDGTLVEFNEQLQRLAVTMYAHV